MSAPVRRTRSWMARFAPYSLALLALPLFAPTCGGQQPGVKAFSKGSLIIPTDACYQNTLNGAGTYATPYAACPSSGTTTYDAGNVIRAYGLVYQLLRNNVPVYWVINSQKTGLVDTVHPDVAIDYATGGTTGPVSKFSWTTSACTALTGTSCPSGTIESSGQCCSFGAMPANNTRVSTSSWPISYQGGPFVVDGSDMPAAVAVMKSLGTTFQAVNVHATNVAFSAEVARAMSGNFSSSGGAIPPPIALLNITGGDTVYAEPVIQGYLNNAGLGSTDFPGAGGTATPTGHGKIYDDLAPADFLPSTCTTSCANGSACTSGFCSPNLTAYQYSVLWVPHWQGPGSAGMPTGTTYVDILAAIRDFLHLGQGHDILAECAGLGTFEGVNHCTNFCSSTFEPGTPAPPTQFQTAGPATGGMDINNTTRSGVTFLPVAGQATYATPFLQIGDFPFATVSGAIQQFRPSPSTATVTYNPYAAGVVRLIADGADTNQDYFTWLKGTATNGHLVYLAGHDYGGATTSYPLQVAGTRLVLNTLFNLGAACTATHTPCTAQALGICRNGTRECCTATDVAAGTCSNVGDPFCKPGAPQPETCNGLDDDCDGIVDNNLAATDTHVSSPACYTGPAATVNPTTGAPYGICRAGTWTCEQTGTSAAPSAAWACIGQVLPTTETCNGLDDDCNGVVDDNVPVPGGSATCFTGPTFTGTPVPGTSTGCQVSGGTLTTTCLGQCKTGTWQCQAAAWVCSGQVLPAAERCESTLLDYNCNGIAGDGCDCALGTSQPCAFPSYPGYAVTPGIGICRAGTQTCVTNPTAGGPNVWGACTGQVLPHLDGSGNPAEICGNGLDDDCNGVIDDPAQCNCKAGDTQPCYPAGTAGCTESSPGSGVFTCVGVCAPGVHICVNGQFSSTCTSAVTPSTQEKCNGKNDTCSASWTNDNAAPCPSPFACVNGVCTIGTLTGENPQCRTGYVASGTTCVPMNCPTTQCAAGTVCVSGACVDPCAGKTCGEGAYCSGGACVGGGCTGDTTACPGQVCRNGTCQADVCAGVTCPSGTFCRGNYGQTPPAYDCVRPCAAVNCPVGQACGADGFCAADPCATVTCATGQVCSAGTCVADPCAGGAACGPGQLCMVDGTKAICTDDPCSGVTCPVGVCFKGQCQAADDLSGAGRASPVGSTTKSGGCGCGGGEAGTSALLLLLLGVPLARRRPRAERRPRPARSLRGLAALGAVALLLGGAACKSKTNKPNCETCGGDNCVDLRFDAAHCGACAVGCPGGDVCASGTCFPAAQVPTITGVSPSAVSGPTAAVTVTGTGFGSGATLRVSGAVAQQELAATGTSTQLTATVDLTGVGSGTLLLQVVNPAGNRTVSNVVSVSVATPTPSITSLTPAVGVAGTLVPIHVTGSNFTAHAVCIQSVPSPPSELVLPPTSTPTATGMDCVLDLRTVAPGLIDVYVQNENNVRSPPAPGRFEVTVPASAPTITSLSPNPALEGSVVNLVVTGTNFVPGSSVEIDKGSGFAPLATTYVYSTSVRAPLNLTTYAAGAYPVHVVNPGGATSSPASLTVSPTAPVATGLAVSPSNPVFGDTVQLSLSGTGFSSGCSIEIQPPAGTFRAASPPTTTTASLLVASASLVAPGTYGDWNARGSCTSGCAAPPCLTSALPFPVANNVASLSTVVPAGADQGTNPLVVTLTGSNFRSSMTVTLDGANPVAATLDAVTPSTKATASLNLTNTNTGTHLLAAVNSGAAPSNTIAFSVTAGTPTIAGTSTTCSPTTNCTAACAVQVPSPVSVTITGTNFGTGLSVVLATFTPPGGSATTVDLSTVAGTTVSVVDASHILVTLDPTAVLATTYSLQVANPGKAASNAAPFKVSTTTCP